jgi:hypothetical protein
MAAPSDLASQQTRTDPLYTFDIPAQPLEEALGAFRQVTGWTLAGDVDELAGAASSRPVRGRFTASEALYQMLLGTGLGFSVSGERTAALAQQAFVLPGIRVVADAASGYRVDLTRTATKTGTLLRDVPQSISCGAGTRPRRGWASASASSARTRCTLRSTTRSRSPLSPAWTARSSGASTIGSGRR